MIEALSLLPVYKGVEQVLQEYSFENSSLVKESQGLSTHILLELLFTLAYDFKELKFL